MLGKSNLCLLKSNLYLDDQQVDENCKYFTKGIKYIQWFCLQDVAFRSVEVHDDETDMRGNFRKLMEAGA